MQITKDFVYIHMHKTGGQTLNKVIANTTPDSETIGYHYPYTEIPGQYNQLPIVGIVRNPWDWYVSWYAFNASLGSHKSTRTTFFNILSDGGNADVKTTITNLVNLGSDTKKNSHYREALISVFPDTLEGNRGVGLTKNCIKALAQSDKGYYSWLFERMYGELNNPKLHIGRFENLENDFLAIMKSLGVVEAPTMQEQFSTIGHINSSDHSHYSNYLDTELCALITEKDQSLIEHFGYQYQQQLARQPVSIVNKGDNTFRKLARGAINYLKIADNIDVSLIREKLGSIPDELWTDSNRETRFSAHSKTQSLLLMYDEDFRHVYPTTLPLFDTFKDDLAPVLEVINRHFGTDGAVTRIILAKLPAGGVIPPHSDTPYTLRNCHRMHIPVITDPAVDFFVGGERKNLREGEIWEINNATLHTVQNNSSRDRVHLIIDWVPESTVRAEERQSVRNKIFMQEHEELFQSTIVGRNSPCPCNSGSKYKNCHGRIK